MSFLVTVVMETASRFYIKTRIYPLDFYLIYISSKHHPLLSWLAITSEHLVSIILHFLGFVITREHREHLGLFSNFQSHAENVNVGIYNLYNRPVCPLLLEHMRLDKISYGCMAQLTMDALQLISVHMHALHTNTQTHAYTTYKHTDAHSNTQMHTQTHTRKIHARIHFYITLARISFFPTC